MTTRTPVLWLRLVLAIAFVIPGLAAARLLSVYYQEAGERLGRHLDRVAAARGVRHVVPLVALWPLTYGVWRSGLGESWIWMAGWVVAGLALIELFASGLYQRSMATSEEAAPSAVLWRTQWPVKRPGDVRLHRLLEVHVLYATPAIAATCLTHRSDAAAAAVAALFMIRYFAHSMSWADFEAIVHWHMHTRSLSVPDHRGASRVIKLSIDYVVGPANGYIPRLYETEHLRVHHRYDSGPGDLYSPLPYRRSSFSQFAWFAAKVALSNLTALDLLCAGKLARAKRRLLAVNVFLFWLVVVGLTVAGRPYGLCLLLFAYVHGVLQARNQYEWHGLVDPENGLNPMGNTILWVSSHESWRRFLHGTATSSPAPGAEEPRDWTYFDNYHLLHHLHPSAHFDEYVALLQSRAPDILEARSTVMLLEGLDGTAFRMWSGDVESLDKYLISEIGDETERLDYLTKRLDPYEPMRHPRSDFLESRFVLRLDKTLVTLVAPISGARRIN